jgi:hypothetical protein
LVQTPVRPFPPRRSTRERLDAVQPTAVMARVHRQRRPASSASAETATVAHLLPDSVQETVLSERLPAEQPKRLRTRRPAARFSARGTEQRYYSVMMALQQQTVRS